MNISVDGLCHHNQWTFKKLQWDMTYMFTDDRYFWNTAKRQYERQDEQSDAVLK